MYVPCKEKSVQPAVQFTLQSLPVLKAVQFKLQHIPVITAVYFTTDNSLH